MRNGYKQLMPKPRYRPASIRSMRIIVSVTLISMFIIGAYLYRLRLYRNCDSTMTLSDCGLMKDWVPPAKARKLTDNELNARAIIKEVLSVQPSLSNTSKIAFMFLTPGPLPFEKLWEKFFTGHESLFSIYVHASKRNAVHKSPLFVNSDIHSDKVAWGTISMVNAERRLLANAFQDPDNQHFVLLSDSCIPLHNFDYVYKYLMETNISFVDCFEDPGPHGTGGRYSEHMMPEIEKNDFRKGAQWFSMKRQHVFLILSDYLYYTKFKRYCKPYMDGGNCYADEHYLPTFLHMVDPTGIANWSVTHADWSEAKWHPKAYGAQNVTFELLQNIRSIDMTTHITSDDEKVVTREPCMWNGVKKPCFLFARKFYPEAFKNLTRLASQLYG